MQKIFKKSLALAVSAALCLTAFIGCLSVNAEGATPSYVVETKEGTPGEKVLINVKGTDLTAICGQSVDVVVAAGLDVTRVLKADKTNEMHPISTEDGGDYNKVVSEKGTTLKFVDIINFNDEITTADFEFNIEAVIPADAAVGTVYGVTLDGQFADLGEEWVTTNVTNGSVTVIDNAPVEPEEIQANILAHNLLLTDSVGSQISVNVSANGGLTTLGYSDYYLVIDYQSYGEGYTLGKKSITLNPADKDRQNAAGTVHYFVFSDIALYEMPLDYTVTVFLKNAEGNTVAFTKSTTSIKDQALAYANRYSTDTALLKAMADMVNYGAAVQEYFAKANPNSDIASAELPTVGFEDYQQYASTVGDLPASFNTTRELVKNLDESTLRVSSTLVVSSSNSISYQFLTNGYDASKLVAKISYTDSYGRLIEKEIAFSDLESRVSGSNTIYSYVFTDLAIYDLEKTVSVELMNDGIKEVTYNYSAGAFVTQYIDNPNLSEVLTNMELFSQSARIKLVGA